MAGLLVSWWINSAAVLSRKRKGSTNGLVAFKVPLMALARC
jgi:hypothetical protein